MAGTPGFGLSTCKTDVMLRLLRFLAVLPGRFFGSRRDLLLENLALRQQLAVLKRRAPLPRFAASDKWFWGLLQRFWPRWKRAMPEPDRQSIFDKVEEILREAYVRRCRMMRLAMLSSCSATTRNISLV
jgi:hypothetical protein